jgi:hypothetical protein
MSLAYIGTMRTGKVAALESVFNHVSKLRKQTKQLVGSKMIPSSISSKKKLNSVA